MTAGPVPTGPITDLTNNTTPFTTASSSAMDAAFLAVVNAVNDNWAAYSNSLQLGTLPNPDGSVTTAKIRDSAVTTAKLADLAVTAAKIAIGAVGAAQIDPALLIQYADIAINAKFALIDEQFASLTDQTSSIKELSSTHQLPLYRNFFIDEFSSIGNYSANNNVGTATSAWTVTGNTISNPTNGIAECFYINKDFKLADGHVSVVWENPNTGISVSSFAGIGFRGKGFSDMLVAVIFNNTKTIELWKFSNAAYTRLTFVAIDSAQYVTNKPLAIDVEIVGITCTIKVNGKTYITYSDANIISYGNGYCGLIASSSATDATAKTFSSFTIYERIFDTVPVGATNYLFLGDSITMGAGGTTPYPDLFDNLLTTYLSKPISVTNAGVSSDTTALMLARLITLLAANTYNVVCVMGGTNDSRIDLSIPISTAISNLSAMIKRIKSHGAIPLVYTVPPISLSITGSSYGVASYNYIVKLNAQIRQLCIKEKIKCIDVFGAFNDNVATYISGDLLHPNNTGYQLIAQTTLDAVLNKY